MYAVPYQKPTSSSNNWPHSGQCVGIFSVDFRFQGFGSLNMFPFRHLGHFCNRRLHKNPGFPAIFNNFYKGTRYLPDMKSRYNLRCLRNVIWAIWIAITNPNKPSRKPALIIQLTKKFHHGRRKTFNRFVFLPLTKSDSAASVLSLLFWITCSETV